MRFFIFLQSSISILLKQFKIQYKISYEAVFLYFCIFCIYFRSLVQENSIDINLGMNSSSQESQKEIIEGRLRFRVYITTFLTAASLGGMMSMFSMIKDRLNIELHLQQTFLSISSIITFCIGFLDSLLFIGRIFGSILILAFPSKQPKRAYFISCTISSLCQLLLPISIFLGSYGKYVMLLGMFGTGICKAFITIPFLFLSQYYHSSSDKSKLIIWNSLNHIGDIIGIFFGYLVVYQFKLRWDLSYQICVFFYFMFGLGFYLIVEEMRFDNDDDKNDCDYKMGKEKDNKNEKMQNENNDRIERQINQKIRNVRRKKQNEQQVVEIDECKQISKQVDKQIDKQQAISQKLQPSNQFLTTTSNKLSTCLFYILLFIKKPVNLLWVIDFCLQAVFISNIVFWFPYYFTQNGFGLNTAFIAVSFYVANVVGTVVFEIAIKKCSQQKSNIACSLMLIGEFVLMLMGTLLLKADKGQSVYYIMMLTTIGFLSGGATNRICTADFLQLVDNDKKLKYYSIFFSKLIQGLLTVLIMTLTGHLMQKDQHNLFYIMTTTIFLSCVVYTIRKFFIEGISRWWKSKVRFNSLEYIEVEYQMNSLE